MGRGPELFEFSFNTSRSARFMPSSFAKLQIQWKFKHDKSGCKPASKSALTQGFHFASLDSLILRLAG
jgi:hypothetical protein